MQLTNNDPVEKFAALFQKGYDAWVEAGRLVSFEMEKDPDFADRVHAKHPEISCDTVYAFDRLGQKQLHPKLLISDSPGAKRLRRLPYSVQEKYCEEPISVLIRGAKREWEKLEMSVFNLTAEQAMQVFDSDSIRNDAAQRAWLENRATKAMIQIDEPYRVSGRKLVVLQPCQFTIGQLARLLADMEGS